MNEMDEKKIEQNKGESKSENRGKYTELELRTKGIGKFVETRTHGWSAKLSTYHDEEVKRAFMALKRSLDLLCTNVEN